MAYFNGKEILFSSSIGGGSNITVGTDVTGRTVRVTFPKGTNGESDIYHGQVLGFSTGAGLWGDPASCGYFDDETCAGPEQYDDGEPYIYNGGGTVTVYNTEFVKLEDISEYAPKDHDHRTLNALYDERDVSPAPSELEGKFSFLGVKRNKVIDLEPKSNYSAVIAFSSWVDNSVPVWELAFNKQGIFIRREDTAGGWFGWNRLVPDNEFTEAKNRISSLEERVAALESGVVNNVITVGTDVTGRTVRAKILKDTTNTNNITYGQVLGFSTGAGLWGDPAGYCYYDNETLAGNEYTYEPNQNPDSKSEYIYTGGGTVTVYNTEEIKLEYAD